MLRILEISWLMVMITGFLFGVYKAFTENFAEAIYIFLITCMALFIYLMRRKQRMEMDKHKKKMRIEGE